MKTFTTLYAERRTGCGSGAARRLRREGWVPAAINSRKGHSEPIQLRRHDLEQILTHHVGRNLMLDVHIAEQPPRKLLLQELQRHPVTNTLIHADFREVSMTEKMRVRIPLVLTGDAAGVREGGILEQLLRELWVECLPVDLVEQIPVDVSALHLGKSLLVRELTVPSAFTVLTPGDIVVAIVSRPREEKEAAPEEAQLAEPEVIARGKKEAESEEDVPAGKSEKGKPAEAAKGEKGKGKEKTAAPAGTEA